MSEVGDCEETRNIVKNPTTQKYRDNTTYTTLDEESQLNSSNIKIMSDVLDYSTAVVGEQNTSHWEEGEKESTTGTVSSQGDKSSETDETTDTEDPTTEADDSEDSAFKKITTRSDVSEESNDAPPVRRSQLNFTTSRITRKSWRREDSASRISEGDEDQLSSADASCNEDTVEPQDGRGTPVKEKVSVVDMDVVAKLAESKGVDLGDIDGTNVSEPIEITDIKQFDSSEVTKLTALFELEKNKCTNISKSEDGINLKGKQKGYQVSCTINYELPPKSKLNMLPGHTISEPLKMDKSEVRNVEGTPVECKPPKRVKPSGNRDVKMPKRLRKNTGLNDTKEVDSSGESFDCGGGGGGKYVGARCALTELIYWREPRKTALVFGTVFSFLLATCLYSVISVVAYTCLVVIVASTVLRLYAKITNKSFDELVGMVFDLHVLLTGDNFHELTEFVAASLILVTLHLKTVFLAEDLFATLKMLCTLWYMTYVGGWFNGVTLVMMSLVAVFTLPKTYQMNQPLIDGYVAVVTNGWANLVNKRTTSQIQIEEPLKEKLELFLNRKKIE